MLEIIGLIVSIGAITRTARRRGGNPWLWGSMAFVGYLAAAVTIPLLLPDLAPLYMLVGGGWIALILLAAFLAGGTRSANVSWQCMRCGLYNGPSTLVCDCGNPFPIH